MTTTRTIIEDALGELGVIGAGEAADAADASLALRYLNRLIARLSTTRSAVFARVDRSIAMTGAASYSVSPRPVKIEHATCINSSGIEYPVDVVSRETFDGFPFKDWGGSVEAIYYDASMTPTVYVYPKAPAGYTLKLDVLDKIQTLELATTLQMPEEYEAYLVPALAVDLANQFGRQASPDLLRRTATALRTLKRVNYAPVLMTQELASEGDFEFERGS